MTLTCTSSLGAYCGWDLPSFPFETKGPRERDMVFAVEVPRGVAFEIWSEWAEDGGSSGRG